MQLSTGERHRSETRVAPGSGSDPGTTPVTNRRGLDVWILAGAAAVMAVVQVFLWDHVTDDAYITFRYVTRLVDGHGLTFNPGERVEGFSNPLWTGILALASLASSAPVADVARVLGFAAALVTLLALFRIVRSTNPGGEAVAFAYAAAILLATPGFHVYATAGLETPLLGMLVAVGVMWSLAPSPAARARAASCFGLAAIARPEAPLYALLWWMFTGGPRRLRATPRRELAIVLLLAAPVVAYEAFRISYFGEWLPNTFVAKPPGTFGGLFGVPPLLQWCVALGGPLLAVVWLLRRPASDAELKSLFRVCGGPVVAAAVFMVYAMADWMPFGRFIVPVAPLLAACTAAVLARWTLALVREGRTPLAVAASTVIVALGSNAFAAWNAELRAYVKNEGNNHVMRGVDQIAAGEWLRAHIRPGATVATKRLGGIGFGAPELVVWDLLGLTDREQALFVRSGRTFGGGLSPVEMRMPDVMAATDIPGHGYKTEPGTVPWLTSHYFFVKSLPQGNFGSIDIWVAKERFQEVVRDLPGPLEPPPCVCR